MAKRNQRQVVNDRWEKKEQVGRKTSEKHLQNREQQIASRPIKPMNELQSEYLHNCRTRSVNIATGYAGTSKTYIPTRVAIEKLLREEIKRIVIVRPPVSDSKSLGFFGGDKVEKCMNWILPVVDILNEFLGSNNVINLIENDVIVPVPLETIKGCSFRDSFIIVDEAEDLTPKEFVKCVTRIGEGSTIVFAGDILQTDLKSNNGLELALDLAEDTNLDWGVVDFNRPSDIVRSEAAKQAILALRRIGYM